MSKEYLVPANGKPLPFPGGELPAIGDHVEVDMFWRRRLADGDVVKGKAPKPGTEAETPSEKK